MGWQTVLVEVVTPREAHVISRDPRPRLAMRSLPLNDLLAIVSARDGMFLVNRKDVFIGRSIEIYGEHGGIESKFLQGLLKAGDYVIEVGANIGAHTVGLAKTVGSNGRVDAYEAQRACYALLQAQIALNQLHNTHAYHLAVGEASGQLWVPTPNYARQGNFGGIALLPHQTDTSEPVEVVSLDERASDRPCTLLKIDVEGMEEEVIRGARTLINKQSPLLYVENDRVEKSKPLVALLLGFGYRLWWHTPMLYNPANHFGVAENAYPRIASYNMFCCREHHPAASGLTEIKSPDETHPLAPRSTKPG
jgi:FkbM family methyltransferase